MLGVALAVVVVLLAALFYFYAGALAVSEHKCSTNEDFEPFLLGLVTRAPVA